MILSRPVAFQNPAAVARFVRVPVGYFLSLWLKKYQSFCGVDPILHLSTKFKCKEAMKLLIHKQQLSFSLKTGQSNSTSCTLLINQGRRRRRRRRRRGSTLNIPWLELVKINFTDYIKVNLLIGNFLPQIVVKKFLFCGMKSKAWRDLRLTIYGQIHIFCH